MLYWGVPAFYSRECPQPIKEEYLLTGPLEATNEAYAIAKIAGIKLCQSYRRQYGSNFVSAMQTNLYGPNDNFDLQSAHVLPALIRKFHDAKESGAPDVAIWGSGSPKRGFLHVDDLADACVYLMRHYEAPGHINVGTGEDLSIKKLAEMVRQVVYPAARLVFRYNQTGRIAQKAARHRLAAQHRTRGGDCRVVSLVSRESCDSQGTASVVSL